MPPDPLDPNPAIPGYGNHFSGPFAWDPAQAQPQLLTPGPPPNLSAAGLAAEKAGAPTGTTAKTNASKSDQKLSGGSAKPCATCTQTDYSVAFRLKDSKGRLCKGAYYTVHSNDGNYTGTIDDNGLTERYYGAADGKIWLYLGHRTQDDGYPESQDGKENTYDEAPLKQDTFAPVAENKTVDANTKRQWKPWSLDAAGRKSIKKDEGQNMKRVGRHRVPDMAHVYNDSAGNATDGYGHLMHTGPATAQDQQEWQQQYGYSQDAGVGGNEQSAQAYSETQLDSDIKSKAGSEQWNDDDGAIKVPLYQSEYNALVNFNFNSGSTAVNTFQRGKTPENRTINHGASMKTYINRGRYYKAGANMKTTSNTTGGEFASELTGRRNAQSSMFMQDGGGE